MREVSIELSPVRPEADVEPRKAEAPTPTALGWTFESAASATSTPVLSCRNASRSLQQDEGACSCGMQGCGRGAGLRRSVLLDQWVENQSTVDTSQYGVRGILRPRFHNHQAFALLTSHIPTSCLCSIPLTSANVAIQD
jgi:hypothetical protein